MKEQLLRAYEAIPVPAGLAEQVLAACEAAPATPTVLPRRTARRWMTPAVSLAACAAVLFVTLAATGRLPGGSHHGAVVPPLSDGAEEEPDSTTTNTTTTTGRTENNAKPGEVQATTTANKSTTTKNFTTSKKMTMATTKKGIAPSQPLQTTRRTVSTTKVDHCMYSLPGDYISMTLSQLAGHFGRRLQPAWLPEDLELVTFSSGYGVWYRNEEKMQNLTDWEKKQFENGTWRDAEVIYDQNGIHYHGEGARTLNVSVSTAPYPRNMLGDLTRFDEAVTVAGTAVKLAYYDDSAYGADAQYAYSALFVVEDVEFYLNSWNIPREEFLKILESLL